MGNVEAFMHILREIARGIWPVPEKEPHSKRLFATRGNRELDALGSDA